MRRWRWACAAVLTLLLLPYLVSRLASPLRSVSIHENPQGMTATDVEAADYLRIATFNLRQGRGPSDSAWQNENSQQRRERLAEIASLLAKLDADVIVLNEVDFDCSASDRVNQARFLAEQLKFKYWVEQPNLDYRMLHRRWRSGNAVLSRIPVARAQWVALPSDSAWRAYLLGQSRAVYCDLRMGSETVRIVAAQLSATNESLRLESTRVLNQIPEMTEDAVFLVGDLGTTHPDLPGGTREGSGANPLEILVASGWYRIPDFSKRRGAPPASFPARQPRELRDWVLIPEGWQYAGFESINSAVSNHWPVVVDAVRVQAGIDVQHQALDVLKEKRRRRKRLDSNR